MTATSSCCKRVGIRALLAERSAPDLRDLVREWGLHRISSCRARPSHTRMVDESTAAWLLKVLAERMKQSLKAGAQSYWRDHAGRTSGESGISSHREYPTRRSLSFVTLRA